MPNKIYHGDALEVMRQWPPECVDMCVTSPPYWGLRDYQVEGQLGREKTPDEYIEKLVVIFREVCRVLRPWGTVWLNMGDTHASGKGSCYNPGGGATSLGKKRKAAGAHPLHRGNISDLRRVGLKPKELCGIPGRLVEALQADGWWRKSDIIWFKRGPMPESMEGWRWEQHRIKIDEKTEDCPGCPKCEKNERLVLRKGSGRPTRTYEYIFLLAKSAEYFFDSVAVQEPSVTGDNRKPYGSDGAWQMDGRNKWDEGAGKPRKTDASKRNIRNIWMMPTGGYPGAHYATFPEELPRRCILAGTSARGNCAECGKPWVRVVDKITEEKNGSLTPKQKQNVEAGGGQKTHGPGWRRRAQSSSSTLGWLPSCSCGADIVSPVVFDPFGGSGTTGMVAAELGRDSVLIELNRDYIEKQAMVRIGQAAKIVSERPLFNAE